MPPIERIYGLLDKAGLYTLLTLFVFGKMRKSDIVNVVNATFLANWHHSVIGRRLNEMEELVVKEDAFYMLSQKGKKLTEKLLDVFELLEPNPVLTAMRELENTRDRLVEMGKLKRVFGNKSSGEHDAEE